MTPKFARAQTLGPAPLLPIPCRCRGAPLTKGGYGKLIVLKDRPIRRRKGPCAARRTVPPPVSRRWKAAGAA
jgi:hypothetical protein